MSKALLTSKQGYCLSQYPKRWGWIFNPNYGPNEIGQRPYLGVWRATDRHILHFYWNCPWKVSELTDMGYQTKFYFGKVRRNRSVRHSRNCSVHSS